MVEEGHLDTARAWTRTTSAGEDFLLSAMGVYQFQISLLSMKILSVLTVRLHGKFTAQRYWVFSCSTKMRPRAVHSENHLMVVSL